MTKPVHDGDNYFYLIMFLFYLNYSVIILYYYCIITCYGY